MGECILARTSSAIGGGDPYYVCDATVERYSNSDVYIYIPQITEPGVYSAEVSWKTASNVRCYYQVGFVVYSSGRWDLISGGTQPPVYYSTSSDTASKASASCGAYVAGWRITVSSSALYIAYSSITPIMAQIRKAFDWNS